MWADVDGTGTTTLEEDLGGLFGGLFEKFQNYSSFMVLGTSMLSLY